MSFEPTPSQRAAVESRGSAILVSAGAGSGKTMVLTKRLMARITDPEDPKDIDSFLVITFTRAAAGELRGRIMKSLSDAAAADPENARLRRQAALCRRAEIGTIHSFCSSLLRRNCQQAGLTPDFRVLEEERAEGMKKTSLERAMNECYAFPDAHPGFLELVDTVGAGRDDSALCALVLDLHSKMQCHPRPRLWAERIVGQLTADETDAGETVWGRELLSSVQARAEYWTGEMERLLSEMASEPKTAAAYGPSVEKTAEGLRELSRAAAEGWDAARERREVPFSKLNVLRNAPDPELAERVKACRDACKKDCEKIREDLSRSSADQLAGMRLTGSPMRALLELTLFFDEKYKESKHRANVLDYSDLEHCAAELLTDEDGRPTELARSVAARYTEIMVDEYQDVSEVQDRIFTAVSQEGSNLFTVGDVKQSIYRFRLADPTIFLRKYDSYADYAAAAPGAPRRVLLQENFRSRHEILDAANTVFSACMSRELGEIDYDADAALKFGAKGYEGTVPKPELLLLKADKPDGTERVPPCREQEAEMAAREIERLIREGTCVTVDGVTRAAEYGDVAILLRTAGRTGDVFQRALTQRGIPVSSAPGSEFFASPEITAVVNLLSVIDNPRRDIPLLATLRSLCFGFTADDLAFVRAADRHTDLYSALCMRSEDSEKCASFLEKLGALREAAPELSCEEIVRRVIGEFDLLAAAGALEDGERHRANLLELIRIAGKFESSGYRGLHRFVQWLRRLAEKGSGGAGEAAPSGVKILSIHKSKGLEFPIVFLCDLGHPVNLSDASDRVLVHPVLGLGAKVTDLERRVEYPTLARKAIAHRIRRETLSEEMRLLYVAMTRAKEYLIMTASDYAPEKLLEKARKRSAFALDPEALAAARSMLGWVMAAIEADGGEHLKLRIVGKEDEADRKNAHAETAEPDGVFLAKLRRNLSFVYPYADAVGLPSKITATELKDRAETDEEAKSVAPHHAHSFRRPRLSGEKEALTAARKGTVTHLALQHLDLDLVRKGVPVGTEVGRLHREGFLTADEASAVDTAAIEALFASPLGKRILAADKVRREFRFSLLCDAEELLGMPGGEKILLQGIVDCLLEEDGELTVIDYKTDAVHTEEEIAERTALYTPQLQTYAMASSRIFSLPVKACRLYFLAAARTVDIVPRA